MHRLLKLLSLVLISLSVYWVYQKTMNSHYQVMSIGDQYSLGITSFGVKENSYLDYVKEELLKTKEKVELNTTYNQKDQNIKNVLFTINQTNNIKKDLYNTNLLILSLGYNDVMYKLSLETKEEEIIETIEKQYTEMIIDIRKYYKKKIVVIGYLEDDRYDSSKQKCIQELNKILKNNPEIIYVDTNELLKDRNKYYSNPRNNYPNSLGYKCIANKIIQKTLENKENI